MIVTARAFWAPKAGNRTDEYEDAFWPLNTAKRAAKRKDTPVRFAVADGATETSFSGLWARRLVRAYGEGCLGGDDWDGWLRRLQREQAAWYGEVLQKPLPWYAEDKVRDGAYAALLGLELTAAGEWGGVAVGDCCLLQWRGDELAAVVGAGSPVRPVNAPPCRSAITRAASLSGPGEGTNTASR